jgi:hypothetical protein
MTPPPKPVSAPRNPAISEPTKMMAVNSKVFMPTVFAKGRV